METLPARKGAMVIAASILVAGFLIMGLLGLIVFVFRAADDLGFPLSVTTMILLSMFGAMALQAYAVTKQVWLKVGAALLWILGLFSMGFVLGHLEMHGGLVAWVVFSSIGLMLYLLFVRGEADARPLDKTRVVWERLGSRRERTPAERDVPAPH